MPLKLKGTLKPGEPDRRYYMIRVQEGGRRVVISSGVRDHAAATKKEQRVIEALQKNPDISKDELVALVRGNNTASHRTALRASNGVSLKEAFDRCFSDPEVWADIKGQATQRINTGHLMQFFGADRPIKAIDRDDIRNYIEFRRDEEDNSPATIKRQLSCLGRMFTAALDWKDGVDRAPRIPRLSSGTPRKFVLNSEQEARIFEEVLKLDEEPNAPRMGPPRKKDAHKYKTLYAVLLESGMRLGEGLNLRHQDIDYGTEAKPGIIKLWRTDELKNGQARTIPMTRRCREALMECRHVPEGPFKDLYRRRAQDIWRRSTAAAGITDPECVIHSLRHTCATRLLELTGNIKMVQEWLGHTTITTTSSTYAHVVTRTMLSAAQALDQWRGT